MSNAFELMVARRLITAGERRSVLQQPQDDIDAQRLMPLALALERLGPASGLRGPARTRDRRGMQSTRAGGAACALVSISNG